MIWLLMGWEFVLAEVIGALVLIGVMWLLVSKIVFPKLEEKARAAGRGRSDCCHGGIHCCA